MEMMGLAGISCLLLCSLHLSHGKISEYRIESETLSRCEALRGVAVARQQDHVPHCSEDGRFRQVQCSGGGEECWCVNSDGEELLGTRMKGSAVHCMTSCQLQRQRAQLGGDVAVVPQCQASGEYQHVQCDSTRGQCWCVDLDGMEIYGTRQNGKPSRCPGSCEIRSRRVLHGSGGRSPPQCSDQGTFLPVQCKFVNMTDMKVFDLLHNFNRFPEAFQTFSNFRRTFPEVSSFCSCADSRGRELPSTGLELLLDEVYDTAFSAPSPGRSFSQTNMYRILQRRFLAVHMAMSGSFRCPTHCERERSEAAKSSGVFVPSCDASGGYMPTQCQAGGQCWCVDPSGKEVFGTRRQGAAPDCAAVSDCPSARRRALSRLFSGPQADVFSAQRTEASSQADLAGLSPCSPHLQQLRQLLLTSLPEGQQPADLPGSLTELLRGLFPSGALALQALSVSRSANPRRLQENLFGGKFLKNAARFNFSGAVGTRGTLSFASAFRQVGLTQDEEDLVRLAESVSSLAPNLDRNISDAFGRSVNLKRNEELLAFVSSALESPAFLSALRQALQLTRAESSGELDLLLSALLHGAESQGCNTESSSLYVPSCTPGGRYQEVQCRGSECWCVDANGQEVAGSRSPGRRPRCPSQCERERAVALKTRANRPAGAESFVPKCSEDGSYVALQCQRRGCFCLGRHGERQTPITVGQTVQCPQSFAPGQGAGSCSTAQREVADFLETVERTISVSNTSHSPLGSGFLLAEGVRLTQEDLLHRLSSQEEQISDKLLSHSNAALRLAAYSTLQFYWRSQQAVSEDRPALRLGYQPYSPQCDVSGRWLPTQCHPSTGHCWCVDEDGLYIPGSLASRSLKTLRCQTPCQRAHARALLSDWTPSVSDITTTSSYIPSCDATGQFSVLQREGPDSASAWCVSPATGEALQPADLSPSGLPQCPSLCQLMRDAAERKQAGDQPECRADGSFVPSWCDLTHCWCVSEDGQELPATRAARSTGRAPACESPRCPFPFSEDSISHGALVCRGDVVDGQQRQSCDLVCHQGYELALPVESFQCDVESQTWLVDAPLPQACQRVQVLQTVQTSVVVQLALVESERPCSSQTTTLQTSLLTQMHAQGLCSLQLSPSGSSVSVCDDSSVRVACVSEETSRLEVTWRAPLSELPVASLPDLHDIDIALSESRLQEGLLGMLGGDQFRSILTSDPQVVSASSPSFGCSRGYRPGSEGTGCVLCPAGTFSSGRACHPCPQGTYQDLEGRYFCTVCPRDATTAATGASAAKHCLTECQRRGLQCSEGGDFLLAQRNVLSERWRCVTAGGAELEWTSREEPLSEEDCTVLGGFETVPSSRLVLEAEDSDLLNTQSSDSSLQNHLTTCLQACSQEQACHHVAIFSEGKRAHCELYSAHADNVHCNASEQTSGFLGNPDAAMFMRLSCSMRVRGGAREGHLVFRKKGQEVTMKAQSGFMKMQFRKINSGVYRTMVFSAEGTTLTDSHRFCQDACSRDTCCEGFILNKNVLNGGAIMCGLLRSPAVLQCAEGDWDVSGLAKAARICGAGLTYDEQHKSFVFNFGGQNFTINDAALPATSKNKSDYQASIIEFQAVYLHTESVASDGQESSTTCVGGQQALSTPLTAAVREAYVRLESSAVLVEPERDIPRLLYWISKQHFSAQEAELWCQTRCQEEEQCSMVDVREDGARYFSCSLYPDTQVCGAYDKPLRQACQARLPQEPQNAHIKKVDLSGGVKSFYSRVPFKKMVSYSVRSRVSLATKPLTEGFMECERRCDEDPCCRGIGYVRDKKSPGVEVLCLTLNSLGIQTCGEETTTWRVQDCSPSAVDTGLEPYGWYEKPVNQWTKSPALCPKFDLRSPSTNVSMEGWWLLEASSVLVDPSLSTYDVLHLSRDISEDLDRTTAWCLSACEEAESCAAVSVGRTHSAARCVLYPDTRACGPAPPTQYCRLVIREAALRVYLRKELNPAVTSAVTSVSVPGHGTLLGVSRTTTLGSDRKTVSQFLGVPYARPPIGALRFSAPQPAEWTDTWNATAARASCLQPGDLESSFTSEDCLYLNIFVPSGLKGSLAVFVFFYNPSGPANHNAPGLLDGSHLAAVGNIIVVTVNTRVAALGFLSTGSASLPGNYGLQDQTAALRWVKENIALVGGDPGRVTLGAERGGADVASLHLLSSATPPLFRRTLLMGGSVFSPSAVLSASEARRQAEDLARELGCLTSDPDMTSCLRAVPARALNAAQTKLLSVSGPLKAWSPVVDGVQVRLHPQVALQSSLFHRADLLLGSSEHDGLISRARNIKNFEELQGRADSKTAFYAALSNSLSGKDANVLVKEAAAWFYSLQHSPTPAGYSVFSRALDNATRDLFIVCPTVKMAAFWAANSRSKVFQYHLPEATAQTSGDASVPLDVQYVFGAPHHPATSQSFTASERRLSLQMTSYIANFIKTGDPNQAHPASRVATSPALPYWPAVQAQPGGDGYKEVGPELRDGLGLHRAACSFWSDYVPALTSATATLSLAGLEVDSAAFAAPTVKTTLLSNLPAAVSTSQAKTEKDAYS